MADLNIKKWNGTAWEDAYPETTVGQIVSTGTPSSSTFLRGDGTWSSTFPVSLTLTNKPLENISGGLYWDGDEIYHEGHTPTAAEVGAATSTHSHGSLANNGTLSNNTAPGSGQHLVITSTTDQLQQSNITFGTSTTTFLANNGTWQTPAGGGSGNNETVVNANYQSTSFTATGLSPTEFSSSLTLPSNENGTFRIQAIFLHTSDTSGSGIDFGVRVNDTSGLSLKGGVFRLLDNTGITGTTTEDSTSFRTLSSTTSLTTGAYVLGASGPASTPQYAMVEFFITKNVAASRTFYFQFANEVSTATLTVVNWHFNATRISTST